MEILDRIPLRLQLTEQLNNFEDHDNFNFEKIWTIYKDVIPHIGSSGVAKTDLSF